MRALKWCLVGWAASVGAVVLSACGGGGGGGTTGSSDTAPPRFIEVRVTPSLITEGSTAIIEALVVDPESGVAQVRARVQYPNGQNETYQLQQQSGTNRFTVQWTVPFGVAGEQSEIRIALTASDTRGNTRDFEYTPSPRLVRQPPDPPKW